MIELLLAMVLADNLVLNHMAGAYVVEAGSRRMDVVRPLAAATVVMMLAASALGHLLHAWLLLPLGLEALLPLLLMPLLALAVPPAQRALRRHGKESYAVLLPLALVNSGLLAVVLLHTGEPQGFFYSLWGGLGYGLGFALVLLLFAGLRERATETDLPAPFRGLPISLITLGLLSMALSGLS
ncbi:MAG: NADH:quinone oxidoreductase [Gammaproteobacteria bacterium]|nr:NADH:quinone oxidoreductase [Gammaproteobacteria bacterium]MDD9825066.1 NADH:quinone oxidoreductase [Gammaproteobacteria bacterium]MDD9863033.1 NADH:quinone oxidoreductase [Gammaproteobacteria bacterium]